MTDPRPNIHAIARKHLKANDPTGWFEELYTAAGFDATHIPWAHLHPNPNLVQWQEQAHRNGTGKTALVVGCGLGDDAHYLQTLGYAVTAFDVSETAIRWCQQRWQGIRFQVADLLHLPAEFEQAFDFVLEINTIQALPRTMREETVRAIAKTVKPGGDLLVICAGRDPNTPLGENPPWPISPAELSPFEAAGLSQQSFEDYRASGLRRFRVHYHRDG